jgi:hypothetical protein
MVGTRAAATEQGAEFGEDVSFEQELERELAPLRRRGAKIACPRCGARGMIPIIWGFVTPPWDLAEDRGEVKLGGCLVEDGLEPEWSCPNCALDFT